MPSPIPTHLSAIEAQERLIAILAHKYDEELVALFEVNTSTRKTPRGLHLPAVVRWYRQPEPSRSAFPDPQHAVVGFCAQIGPAQRGQWKADVGASFVSSTLLPFGVGIYFLESLTDSIEDAAQPGSHLGPDEILLERAYCYLGALKHTLVKYGCHHRAVADLTPNADMGLGGSIGSRVAGGEDRELLGIVLLEIAVGQDEAFPGHATFIPPPPSP